MFIRMFGTMIPIKLPDLGEGTKDATIKEWFVKEGQHIKEVTDFPKVLSMMIFVKSLLINLSLKFLQLTME